MNLTLAPLSFQKFGRKPTIMIANIIALLSSITCAFSTTFIMFTICRFLIAVGTLGAYNTLFILLMEISAPKQRTSYGVTKTFGWSTGYVILPVFAWIVRDWSWLQLIITLPLIPLLCSYRIILESPRWLLTKGRTKEAEETLRKIMKINKSNVDVVHERLQHSMEKTNEPEEKNSNKLILFLLFGTELRRTTIINIYLWFATSLVFYGMSYNTNALAGDFYVNFGLSGLIEFPGILLALIAMKRFGRRTISFASLCVGGIFCLVLYLSPSDPWWVSSLLATGAKMCGIVSFIVVLIYTAELFPTSVRSLAFGLGSAFARIASIIAPFARELGNVTHPFLPQMIFGALGILGGILVRMLPETQTSRISKDPTNHTFENQGSKYKKPDGSQDEITTNNPHSVLS